VAHREFFDGYRVSAGNGHSLTYDVRPVYLKMRALAIGLKGIDCEPDSEGTLGFFMEIGYDNSCASVTAYCNGHASIKTSTGGGYLPGPEPIDAIRHAARAAVSVASESTCFMEVAKEYPLPLAGWLNFCVLTRPSIFWAAVRQDDVKHLEAPLHPLYRAADSVITEFRLAAEAGLFKGKLVHRGD
jgi:hypothetical protein